MHTVLACATFSAQTRGFRLAHVLTGELESVEETRVEVVVPPPRLSSVVAALREAHPYEEVAFDVFDRVSISSPMFGMGRVGVLPSPMTQVMPCYL